MITLIIIFISLLIAALVTLLTCGSGILIVALVFSDVIFAIWIIVKLVKCIGKH